MVGFEPPVQQFAHGEHRCRAGDRASGPVLVGELRGVLLGMGAAAADRQGSVLGAARDEIGADGDADLPDAWASFTYRPGAACCHQARVRASPPGFMGWLMG